jgi:hypothetical protein
MRLQVFKFQHFVKYQKNYYKLQCELHTNKRYTVPLEI